MDKPSRSSSRRCTDRNLIDLFGNGVVGLHFVGADGRIIAANQAELDLLGYMAEEYIGHHISEFHADPAIIDDILQREREHLQEANGRLQEKIEELERFHLWS